MLNGAPTGGDQGKDNLSYAPQRRSETWEGIERILRDLFIRFFLDG